MQKCRICGSKDFYKEAGYFFCQTCQTQNEDIRDEVLELRIDSTTRLRKTRIRQLKSDISGNEVGWTSWELYNFVLIGLTNELIELGVPSDIKLTILQLWATYLGKLEVAFISTRKKSMPKLARRYKKRDADIIYGKVQSEKTSRKRKRSRSSTSIISGTSITGLSEGSSMRELNKNKRLLIAADYDRYLQSQNSSEGDGLSMLSQSQSIYSGQSSSVKSSENEGKVQFSSHAKEEARKIKRLSKNIPRFERVQYRAKHISTQYKMGPNIITPMRLWAIIYLALRIHNQPIQLGDMLRYGREGHLSYYKLDHLLPPELNLTANERSFLTQNVEITHKGMRRIIARGIQLYTERLIALSPPKMIFDAKKSCIPNYEGRAMAFIIVVLKTLLALDGVTEYRISRIAERINSTAIERGLLDNKLFSFQEWQKYIECRKTILMHAHYPTKMKYCPDADGIDDLYLKFLEFISSKSNKNEQEIKNSKHYLPQEIISAMGKHISNINIDDLSPKAIDIFPPSLTPLHSYLQHLLDHPLYDIPNIARSDFFLTRVGYMTKSDALVELAAKCGMELEIVDSNVHFLEKNVPPFEQPRMPSINELKQLIDVQDDLQDEEDRSESVNDYLHAKTPCSIKFDTTKNQYYDSTVSTMKDSANFFAENDFTFTETLPNGKLAIPVDSDSENEEDLGSNGLDQWTLLENKLRDKYNIHLSLAEKEAIHKSNGVKKTHSKESKIQLKRNSKGQFIKRSAAPIKIEKSDAEFFAATENVNFYDNIDTRVINDKHIEVESTEKNQLLFPENINISDINIDDTNINIDHFDINEYLNFSDISFFSQNDILAPVSSKEETVVKEKDIFFKPFTEYWMYDCIFSRVKSKNFAIFEKSLPRTFRWLLNECALIVEMSTEDLYEEVCLIENYYSHISNSSTPDSSERTNIDSISKSQLNFILNKW
ncbi:TATA box-binding protein-associated factor RNA polymerase I subunit B isoform X2 [Bombus terrestris]|uniref:TATA box-binding protein-associated factor RNA polymerase I subunit B isoform X2 n=1 Tax=Bombus terrestris TaxID=30195 RepID=A0A9C6SKX4_BOMTE|nr:TATA box-binding protein-associated factor RNA polymerase I subunit B isoform X2 [Bombus terrestris]